ncbi:hypothetical protein [uncultured Erythrobacter sp.]|uniref:hypothetical protein n=1 Tax=uncultured Erythrobacter sp. TaxID=263913 RepID=UPI002659AAA8|nr:hypothetical protein [uncultured Erythrobacter sp.]
MKWDLNLENLTSPAAERIDVSSAIATLELQLSVLDRLGAHIAAAHLDAAIQQLRLDHPPRKA